MSSSSFAAEARSGERSPADRLVGVVEETLRDLRRGPERGRRITLDSSLDRDLGLDSLARVELFLRAEHAFDVTLPDDLLQGAGTLRDLLQAIEMERGSATKRSALRPSARARTPPPKSPAVGSPPQGELRGEGELRAEPDEAATLLEVLEWHVARHGERTHVVVLHDEREEEISYAKLHREAAAIAAGLQHRGLQARQTVAIMLPTSPEYFYTYFGILLAGGIPVPIYPPARLSQIEEHVRRHARILANAQASVLVTVHEVIAVARLLEAHVPSVRQIVTPETLSRTRGPPPAAVVETHDIAFIQYTSGSTGNPKGVVLTHANLLANIRAMAPALEVTERDVFVSWLPLYHDMGLIGAWLASLYCGFKLVIMSPLAFLARPERWLQAIHRFGGTMSAGPNFAYELCIKRLEASHLEGIDLSSWRLAFNGAEAVRPDTVARFAERLAPHGFRPDAMTPVYGLAETSLGLLFPPLRRGPIIDRVIQDDFTSRREATPAREDDPRPLRFVSCGRPLPGHEVRIVDELDLEVGERVEGRLQFRGPSATSGYFRNPEETRRLFHGDWLDSGDKAYFADGEFYVTGRVKDIVIRGGRNIYPEALEEAVGALPGVRKGCVAVFGTKDAQAGTERLVVLAETRETDAAVREALRESIGRASVEMLGEPPDDIVLAPPHTVLKTSSGKIRRSASRELYEGGHVGAASRAVWWQIARLTFSGLVAELRDWINVARGLVYGIYVALAFVLVGPATWLVTAFTRDERSAWRIGHRAARLFFRLIRIPLVVRGLENIPRGSPNVLVANHASFLDGLVIAAAIPEPYAFVAKRELRDHFVTRIFLERLGTRFVERFAAQQSVEDARRLANEAVCGKPLAFFPEGTFTRVAGLLPFRLGAFTAALQARVPVVPVAIRGSRAILREGQWIPRRGALVVTIGAPIAPPDEGESFNAAVSLSEAARAHILAHCAEPDLGRK